METASRLCSGKTTSRQQEVAHRQRPLRSTAEEHPPASRVRTLKKRIDLPIRHQLVWSEQRGFKLRRNLCLAGGSERAAGYTDLWSGPTPSPTPSPPKL